MARRYGNKTQVQRKWKKISNMTVSQLNDFKSYLEDQNQTLSKVYDHVVTRLNVKSWV